jgi:hypothetical protein
LIREGNQPPALAAWLHVAPVDVQRRTNPQTMEGELMNAQRTIFASVGAFLCLATASFAQQVKTDYDRSTDFGHYKTYSWEKVQTQDPLWVDRIKEAVNATLTAKGWTPVASGGDVSVVAIEMTKINKASTPSTTGSEAAGAGAADSAIQPRPLTPTRSAP